MVAGDSHGGGVAAVVVLWWGWCWLVNEGRGVGMFRWWCRRRRGSDGSGDGDSGGGSGVTRWWQRVGESGIGDRVDRSKRSLFGFAGKSPPKKFFGGGWPEMVVVAGGRIGRPA
nr:hypothetical protein [Tanacetum cinerariifolium]